MGTLKGQNFRILTYDGSKYSCVGMATSCTITENANTDDSGTKDDVGMAAKPTVNSKSWQVQAESLNVLDAAAMLTAIKSLTPFTLIWDETDTADNQTAQKATFARKGSAYLSDLTLNFNDRENSAKSLQFSGSGPLSKITSETITTEVLAAGSYTKGQSVRLYLSSDNTAAPAAVVAAAKQLAFHVSMQMEPATTKDTAGDWEIQEPVALNFDISTTALVRSGETITSAVGGKGLDDIEDIYEASAPVKFKIANTSGANNRTAGAVIVSGSVIVSQLSINAPNKQNADYTAQLTGYGAYTVGA